MNGYGLFQWPDREWMSLREGVTFVAHYYGDEGLPTLDEEIVARWARDGFLPTRAKLMVQVSSEKRLQQTDYPLPGHLWQREGLGWYAGDWWVSNIADLHDGGSSTTLRGIEVHTARLRACIAGDLEAGMTSASERGDPLCADVEAWIKTYAGENVDKAFSAFRAMYPLMAIDRATFRTDWARMRGKGRGRPPKRS